MRRRRSKSSYDAILDLVGIQTARGRDVHVPRIARLRTKQIEVLTTLCYGALGEKAIQVDVDKRIGVIALLVDLLPRSESIIRKWLERFDNARAYEVQFSIFVCLLPYMGSFLRMGGPRLVERYLLDVPRDTARAAWMAGDLLGSDCPLRSGLSRLRRAAQSARFSAGRLGALHGLAHALIRLEKRGSPTRAILRELRYISKSDRSTSVRDKASRIVAGDRCQTTAKRIRSERRKRSRKSN
jgi:hypothetical protein